ncbi:uncharacterized protein [Misgurnus anguillicaudatus]|uniref:uncharacterized protein n=1 Tax=Misgurnus anguillicaudatus TaxID=75329 RepID=UPI003CCF8657
MLGHSFLHGGPCFAGLSRAFVHVLLQGSEETATLQLEDCPDVDIRETIDLVLGRRTRQIKQIRRGLKETFVWNLLNERKDVALFPKESEDSCTPEMLLSHISWHRSDDEDDDDDDEYSPDIKERITGYLKQLIETASSKDLKNLLKFWVGWERMEANMAVEIVKSDFPKSSNCFCVLRQPGHYNDFQTFKKDLLMCIGTCKYGFGHV